MHSKLIMAKNTLIERTDSMDERLFYRYTPDKPESPPSPPKNTPKKNKIDFKEKKNNTIKSLNQVEGFLNDFKHFKRYIHLYKFFK